MTKFQFVAVAFVGIVIGFIAGYAWKSNELADAESEIARLRSVVTELMMDVQSSQIAEPWLSVDDLRVPGEWKNAGIKLVQMYAHLPNVVINALVGSVISEDSVLAGQQMRNEPILWVMAMITQNYGPIQFADEQRETLKRLYGSKEKGNLRKYLDDVLKD